MHKNNRTSLQPKRPSNQIKTGAGKIDKVKAPRPPFSKNRVSGGMN